MTEHYDDTDLRRILNDTDTIAMIGASQRGDRDSHRVMRYLQQQGYQVIPVNPTLEPGSTILGAPVYASLQDVPQDFQMVDVFRRSDAVDGIVDELLELKNPPAFLWLQLGVVDRSAAAKASDAGIEVVMNRCVKIEHARLIQAAGKS
ncbi:MAG: CoA-binding protein [Woeseiaceae bacterium]|nr:CoA-binding protein [Woeseiaceae bacterium]